MTRQLPDLPPRMRAGSTVARVYRWMRDTPQPAEGALRADIAKACGFRSGQFSCLVDPWVRNGVFVRQLDAGGQWRYRLGSK